MLWAAWAGVGLGQGTYPQSPGPVLGGWQPGSAYVPHTHQHLAAVGERQATGTGLWSPGLHLPCPHPLPWPGPHQRGQLLHITHGLQPPRQPRQSSLLLGLPLLRVQPVLLVILPLSTEALGCQGLLLSLQLLPLQLPDGRADAPPLCQIRCNLQLRGRQGGGTGHFGCQGWRAGTSCPRPGLWHNEWSVSTLPAPSSSRACLRTHPVSREDPAHAATACGQPTVVHRVSTNRPHVPGTKPGIPSI